MCVHWQRSQQAVLAYILVFVAEVVLVEDLCKLVLEERQGFKKEFATLVCIEAAVAHNKWQAPSGVFNEHIHVIHNTNNLWPEVYSMNTYM